jgi:regulator of protease activity HflC (stomatin/prohibitin superfamily)
MKKKAQNEIKTFIVTFMSLLISIVFLTLIFGCVYVVSAGERAVLLTWGSPDLTPQSEGIHFKIPIMQKAVKMNIQTQKYEAELSAASSDLQDVKTKIAINYHLVGEETPIIYRDIGIDYADKLIYPLEQEANKATTSKFTAEQLITKREQVKEDMKTLLAERLRPRGIIVEEISIVDFKFSDSFTQAIEAKVTAEQNALAAKNKLAQVEYEAQQRIAQAEGEAKAIQIQVSAINAQGGQSYVQLQAIKAWDGKLPLYTGGGAIPFINIGGNSTL